MGALHERGEKLQTLQTGMAAMASEAETLYDTARKIRERSEHNSKWLPPSRENSPGRTLQGNTLHQMLQHCDTKMQNLNVEEGALADLALFSCLLLPHTSILSACLRCAVH
eukprot:scaffold37443_cov62-Phaeocystis_antarctica.AAC.4